MTALVRIALTRPLTFIVMALLILIGGTIAALRTPVDIFPEIKIPVVAVVWGYAGLPPSEMEGRIIGNHERVLTTTVNDIEHIESQSMQGIGVIKIFFQPGADIRTATAQVTSVSQTVLRNMPPGVNPPLVLNYNASTVPILQLALSGQGLNEQQLFDLGQNQIRPALVTIPGAAMPFPSGGRQRQIQIDIDPVALQTNGLSAQDVANAVAAQNQINPAGFAKIGIFQYSIHLNNAPSSVEELNNLPIKVVNGATIYMRDVAHVRDGSAPQTNVVHVDGHRSALLTVLKNGATSTIAIVEGVKAKIPELMSGLPPTLKVLPIGDQSLFVKAALEGVVKEGALAAALTSLMILLFLGSWRSTVIIAVSIPLAVLAAIAALAMFGQTLNVMTLGGLALAVGILVDDATVTIENINWHLEQGKGVVPAILDGAAQIVTPAFVSLLCICIVFVPMFALPGVAGFLFVPMALSVVFAMIASFILSRTLVPTMAMYLLKPHAPGHGHEAGEPGSRNPLVRFQRGFEVRFEKVRDGYGDLLGRALNARKPFIIGFLAVVLISFVLVPFLGRNFFPTVDSGQMMLHVRAPIGSRIENTSAEFDRIQRHIRRILPAGEVETIIDNIGLPVSGINVVYNNSGTVGPQDGDILISLKEGHAPTQEHMATLRRELPKLFPSFTFSFLPADITSQILNFGSPAPIDIQVTGRNVAANRAFATKILKGIRSIPGVADARIQQSARYPQLDVNVNRSRIGQFGLTERDVTNSVATTLAGTLQTAPVFYLNPQNGITYPVVGQTPEYQIDSVASLSNIPIAGPAGTGGQQVLGGIADIKRSSTAAVASHYNIQPVIDIYAAPAGRDLGAVSGDIAKVIKRLEKDKPDGITVTMRGQYQTMNAAFSGLGYGLLGAIVLIYLLIVVNFQSWLDPFVIITALPAALAGIVWMLFASGTTLSVPALTGAIMCMGVATANSILVVSFARERLAELGDATKAALEAGMVRFRPVLMTALAMIIGMAPMAFGLGEGGEQNAPLGRAVIGGLAFATIATLLFVPVVFAVVHSRRASKPSEPELAHV
ncbi:efflux RND transporter permease subunit [Sphingomonas montanisoli]|uniref:Efflux RND transporter permease subunit n=1 Tax=Sphingomonas montanisoli TaxID=2606412 RepID=A0A5D9C7D8_9SPHN|nr:efflux RND transporter permease subunit [Sphingomonas montanisoli]TZG25911.1 efflux RND transporter permease subunit [Sphingomonas montanisoli]